MSAYNIIYKPNIIVHQTPAQTDIKEKGLKLCCALLNDGKRCPNLTFTNVKFCKSHDAFCSNLTMAYHLRQKELNAIVPFNSPVYNVTDQMLKSETFRYETMVFFANSLYFNGNSSLNATLALSYEACSDFFKKINEIIDLRTRVKNICYSNVTSCPNDTIEAVTHEYEIERWKERRKVWYYFESNQIRNHLNIFLLVWIPYKAENLTKTEIEDWQSDLSYARFLYSTYVDLKTPQPNTRAPSHLGWQNLNKEERKSLFTR